MSTSASSASASIEVEKHARERWWREEELVNQRLGWLLASHGIVGAGYAWLKHRIAEVGVDIAKPDASAQLKASLLAYREQLQDLSFGLWLIGIAMSCFVFLGVIAAIVAQRKLQVTYRKHPFQLGVSSGTTFAGYAAAVSVPLICIVGWTVARKLLQ